MDKRPANTTTCGEEDGESECRLHGCKIETGCMEVSTETRHWMRDWQATFRLCWHMSIWLGGHAWQTACAAYLEHRGVHPQQLLSQTPREDMLSGKQLIFDAKFQNKSHKTMVCTSDVVIHAVLPNAEVAKSHWVVGWMRAACGGAYIA